MCAGRSRTTADTAFFRVLTFGAGSENIHGVTDLSKAMLERERIDPTFDGRVHFHRLPAPDTDKVMVVLVTTRSEQLTLAGRLNNVSMTTKGHVVEVAVHRREADLGPCSVHLGQKPLGGDEILGLRQGGLDGVSLPGMALFR
jgi:hypothetical protein